MLKRGQKIKVTEYYGNGSSRPKVGDVGYLSNMMLYPIEKFILADAIFFRYGEKDKNKDRVERKRFIIDIGMSKQLRYKIVNIGIKKSYFVDKLHINLNPIAYSQNSMFGTIHEHDYVKAGWSNSDVRPSVMSTHGIWDSPKSNSTSIQDVITLNKLEAKHMRNIVKLPCVKIVPIVEVGMKKLNDKENISQFRAWFMASAGPILFTTVCFTRLMYNSDKENTLFSQSNAQYKHIISKFKNKATGKVCPRNDGGATLTIKNNLYDILTPQTIIDWVYKLRKIELLNNMLISKIDMSAINAVVDTFPEFIKHILVNTPKKTNFWKIPISTLPPAYIKPYEFMLSVFFRSCINSNNAKYIVEKLSEIGFTIPPLFENLNSDEINQKKEDIAKDTSLMVDILK